MELAVGVLGTLLAFAQFGGAQTMDSSTPRSPEENATAVESDGRVMQCSARRLHKRQRCANRFG